ncbi:PREDICTED: interferon gamma receptor 1 [Chinchilla lanigera]|nr:PREDICTED: interferon gamma receptor 1 [Chinchilla lanigera]
MAVLVLLILLVQCGSLAEMSTAEPEPSSVPVPSNVRIQSYNMNPVLYWDYRSMPQDVVFAVEVKHYGNKWINACNNTPHHHCSISNVNNPDLPIWAKVKARVGQKESAYVESKSFVICEHGKVGPPEVNVTREENHIAVDVIHPLMIEEQESMYFEDPCSGFNYNVYVRVNRSETQKHTLIGEDCLDIVCRLRIPVSSLNTQYCISAEGLLGHWNVKTEMSKENCITIHSSSVKDPIWVPIVVAVLLFLVVILVAAACHFKKNSCKKNKIMLPKSLLSVVKSAKETKPESKHELLTSSYQPIAMENDMAVSAEEVSPVTVSGTCPEGGPGKEARGEEPSTETASLTPDLASGSLAALTENSLHSASDQSETSAVFLNSYQTRSGSKSGLVDSDSFSEVPSTDKTEAKTERQEPIVPRNAPTSFGYDKPHVLVDVLVGDEGAKESLVGYRLPTDSTEFS